jgi:iron complex transport system substrate-binding protein
MTVTVTWSSSNYDYMKVGGTKYNNQNPGGNSTFTFPIPGLGKSFTVIGDTTAMSTPHEIEYTVRFDLQ